MARPKKYSEASLAAYTDLFFEENRGDPGALSFRARSAFAARGGEDIPEQVFRRSEAVRKRISALREEDGDGSAAPAADVYVTLDAARLLEGCACPRAAGLRKTLSDLDGIWHGHFQEMVSLRKQVRDLESRLDAERLASAALRDSLAEKDRQIRKGHKEVRDLVRLIDTCVCRPVAAELVRKTVPDLPAQKDLTPEAVPLFAEPLCPGKAAEDAIKDSSEALLASLSDEKKGESNEK